MIREKNMANRKFEATPELTDLLVKSGSSHKEEALAANHEFAKALELPLRQGVLSGNILDDIFEPIALAQSATPEFPLDFPCSWYRKRLCGLYHPKSWLYSTKAC
jgi:hypothetical protein